jgi:hypothetical protein
MKNLVFAPGRVTCSCCNAGGFFCTTPEGASYHTCPFCGGTDGVTNDDDDFLYDAEKNPYYELQMHYCPSCRILFNLGCTHAVNGCTDDVYNGHVICQWKLKGHSHVYTGMPQFADIGEMISELHKVEILSWVCPNKGAHCTCGAYPKESNPKMYIDCALHALSNPKKTN